MYVLPALHGAWVERRVPLVGTYWYGAHVPFDVRTFPELCMQARAQGAVFLRITPASGATIPASVGSRVRDEEPSTSLALDLVQPLEAIRNSLKPKTRYNIGVAQRHGVRVEFCESPLAPDLFEAVWRLYEGTAARHGIRNHPKEHYQRAPGVWVLAWHEQDLLAAHFCVGYDGTLTYVYGASSDVKKNCMAPYLTQWRTIEWARAHGYVRYDFWGIAPDPDDRTHPYYGITRFKMGFGGTIVHYPGTFEIPLDRMRYFLYRMLKQIQSLRRR